MIIYHASNLCCYIKCILHKMVYHKNDDALFVGYDWLKKTYGVIDVFKYRIDYKPFCGYNGIHNNFSPSEYETFVEDYFDNAFLELNLNISDFKEFHIGSYYGDFSIYLNQKKISHFVHEEGAGEFNHHGVLSIDKQFYPLAFEVRSKYDIYNFKSKYITKKFGILSCVSDDFKAQVTNYEAYNEILKLDDDQRNQVINIFKLPEKFNKKAKILVLTQWFNRDGKKITDNWLIDMYSLLLDYFTYGAEIYLKPHPADPYKTDYTNMFDFYIEKTSYPSELMGLIPDIHFTKALTISSTSIDTVCNFTDKQISTSINFLNLYKNIIKFDVATSISCMFGGTKVSRFGIFDHHLCSYPTEFFENTLWANLTEDNQIVISDTLNWKNSGDSLEKFIHSMKNTSNIFIITNQIDDVLQNAPELKENLLTFQINKSSKDTTETEMIYVFSNDNSKLEFISNFKFNKKLKYTNLTIETEKL